MSQLHKQPAANNPHLDTVQLTPINVRKPEFESEFSNLKQLFGADFFTMYIASIHDLAKNKNTLLITTGNELQKMHIEDIIPALKEIFMVKKVKVIGLMKPFYN